MVINSLRKTAIGIGDSSWAAGLDVEVFADCFLFWRGLVIKIVSVSSSFFNQSGETFYSAPAAIKYSEDSAKSYIVVYKMAQFVL